MITFALIGVAGCAQINAEIEATPDVIDRSTGRPIAPLIPRQNQPPSDFGIETTRLFRR